MKNIALYIHIPFCVGKCVYCDFVSGPASDEVISRYVGAVIKEIKQKSIAFKNCLINTIYVGGGTPSRMPVGELTRIMNAVYQNYNLNIEEFTVEANPITFDKDHANEYAELGVNRISLGVQTLDSRVAECLRRPAKPADAIDAIQLAKTYFHNVNADIILGLPYQTLPSLVDTLNELIRNQVTHISAYGLILSESTPLYGMVKSGAVKLPDEDQAVDMYDLAADILISNGYNRYEISNFAFKGYECKHNIAYWRRVNYVGIGVAAHSLIDDVRSANVENTEQYIKMVDYGMLPVAEKVTLNEEDKKAEAVMLALRCDVGLDIAAFNEEFDTDFLKEYEQRLKNICNFVEVRNGCLRIQPEYIYVSNSIISELI